MTAIESTSAVRDPLLIKRLIRSAHAPPPLPSFLFFIFLFSLKTRTDPVFKMLWYNKPKMMDSVQKTLCIYCSIPSSKSLGLASVNVMFEHQRFIISAYFLTNRCMFSIICVQILSTHKDQFLVY